MSSIAVDKVFKTVNIFKNYTYDIVQTAKQQIAK
jgi:hypothetical protein